jgi:hypothetical protein
MRSQLHSTESPLSETAPPLPEPLIPCHAHVRVVLEDTHSSFIPFRAKTAWGPYTRDEESRFSECKLSRHTVPLFLRIFPCPQLRSSNPQLSASPQIPLVYRFRHRPLNHFCPPRTSFPSANEASRPNTDPHSTKAFSVFMHKVSTKTLAIYESFGVEKQMPW